MPSIEKRSDNTYRITVSCGYDGTGRKLRKYKTITLQPSLSDKQREKELNRQSVLFEKEVENGTYLDGEKITFAEFTQTWLEVYAEKRLAPGTLNPYRMRLKERILPALGHIKLSKLQPQHLMEFYNNLQEGNMRLDSRYKPTSALIKLLEIQTISDISKLSGITFKTCQRIKKGDPTTLKTAERLCTALKLEIKKMFICDTNKKLSDKTVRHHHGIISSILSFAVKWNVITSNPAERADLGKIAKYKPSYYDDIQIQGMFTGLENEPLCYKAMVYLTIDTGMRTGEITGLLWSDIDFEKGIVNVSKQRQYVSGYGTIERAPKTESGFRTISLSKTVSTLLKLYKGQQMQDLFKLGVAWKSDGLVFIHEDGMPMHPHRPYKWFTEFLERHSLPKITYHQLRHTNASLLISAGVDVVTLSGRLGHGDKNITLNTYSHIIKSKEAQAANYMDIFYSKTAEKDL